MILSYLSLQMGAQENISELDQHVIDFVRNFRLEKGLTQLDVANGIYVSRGFINDVESANKPAKYNLRHINALADYFNISLHQFFPAKPYPVDGPHREKTRNKNLKKMPPKSAPKKTTSKSSKK